MRGTKQEPRPEKTRSRTRQQARAGQARRHTPLQVEALEARAVPTIITIGSSKDNTLYQDPTGSTSNGAGPTFYAGLTARAGSIRRGLIAFDIADNVPAGATINSVTLTLNMSKTISGAATVELHRVLADWGEGTSNAGTNGGMGATATTNDATWLYRFYNTASWTNPGGDFSSTVSASTSVSGVAAYTWGSTSQMVADVTAWLNTPSSNFGWVVLGDETTNGSAKCFDTKENATPADRPALTINYTPLPAITVSGQVNGNLTGYTGSQRSMVKDVVYTFNHAVTLGANAVSIALHPNVTVNGVGGKTVGTLPTLSYSTPDGGLTWDVTFSGSGVVPPVNGGLGSIADGIYDLTLNHLAVTDASGQTLAADRVDTFYRLYGDTSGHETVNNSDTFQAKTTFLKSAGQAGYLAYLDYNGDGTVNNTDTFQLKQRFLTVYSGFTPTI
jgi:hypothetical protein